MKLKPQCTVEKGVKRCQLARMPGSAVCWFHMNNDVLFPRDREPVEERFTNLAQFVELLRERQGNVCCICGYRFYGNQDVEVEHLHPLSAGGKNSIENLGLVHAKCNRAKTDFSLYDPEIRKRLVDIGKHFVGGKSTRRRLSVDEEANLCKDYLEGGTLAKVSMDYGFSKGTIWRILKRNRVETRSNKEAHGGLTDEHEQEVCRMYLEGKSAIELGKIFGVSDACIRNTLRRNEVKVRSVKEANGGLTNEQEEECTRRYLAGENSVDLSKTFGVCPTTIGNNLKRRGIKARSNSEAQKLAFAKRNGTFG